jgi:beta-hydroxylase
MFDRLKNNILVFSIRLITFVFASPMWYLCEWESEDPITPIIPVSKRKCIKDIEENFKNISEEIMNQVQHATPIEGDLFFESFVTNDGKWKKIYLKWYAPAPDCSYRMFPNLMSVIDKNKDIRLAMISKLEPGANIKLHSGAYRGGIRVSIGISTPNDPNCYIWISGYKYFWKDGELVAFDDTFPHFVRNNTDVDRIVLLLDIDRKMKNKWSQTIVNWFSDWVIPLTTRS